VKPAAAAALAVAALIPLAAAGAEAAFPPAAITGTVLNHTGGAGAPVGSLPVALRVFVGGAEVAQQTATTDRRGAFAFTVPADPGRMYLVTVRYGETEYAAAPIAFAAVERRKQVALRVYEPTTDIAAVRLNIHHLIVEPGGGAVRITELLVFVNPTDRTYIGTKARPDGPRETLNFRLPPRATDIQYLEGLAPARIRAVPDGFVDTMALQPGVRQIAFTYMIPRAQTIIRTLDYPAGAVEVLGAPAVRLTVAPLTPREPVTTEQGTYSRFSGQALGAGTQIVLGLSGPPGMLQGNRGYLLAALAGVLIAALAYPLLRRRTAAGLPQTRDGLIRAIAALDDLHDAGGIAPAAYRRQRARYKSRLIELTAAEPPTEDPGPDRARES
jgi:hypothetical protein